MRDMCNIDEIMDMLDWNNSEAVQQKGVELAKNINNICAFVQPNAPGKSVWENCARIITDRSDDKLKPYLLQLLEWLQDMNWPGAEIIRERLKTYGEMEMLVFNVECCVEKAVACGKFDEMKFLDNISELLDNKKLKMALSIKTLETLEKHYHNRGWWDEE